jgi:phage terminase large subunit-like protein
MGVIARGRTSYERRHLTFIDKVVKKNEKGQPWQLAPYQRRVLELAFKRGLKGELLYRLVVLSEPKKSGKTFLAACLGLWWAVTTRATEIIVCANDREQAESRVFKTMVDLIEQTRRSSPNVSRIPVRSLSTTAPSSLLSLAILRAPRVAAIHL